MKYTRKNSKKGGVKNKTEKRKKTDKLVHEKDIEEIGKEILGEHSNISIPKTSVSFLIKILHKKSPDEWRQLAKENELYIPLDEYPENRDAILYLAREILELAINFTRDTKKKTVSTKTITHIIENDVELKLLL